jgi:hypothetical protein
MTRVIINTSSPYRVAVNNQQKTTVRTAGLQTIVNYSNTVNNIYPSGAARLVDLLDVDASDSDNNEIVVFEESSNTYVIKTLPVVSGDEF